MDVVVRTFHCCCCSAGGGSMVGVERGVATLACGFRWRVKQSVFKQRIRYGHQVRILNVEFTVYAYVQTIILLA